MSSYTSTARQILAQHRLDPHRAQVWAARLAVGSGMQGTQGAILYRFADGSRVVFRGSICFELDDPDFEPVFR
jgi:hypothetical protein